VPALLPCLRGWPEVLPLSLNPASARPAALPARMAGYQRQMKRGASFAPLVNHFSALVIKRNR